MPIIVNVDVMLAKRKMSSGELAEKVGITPANLSILKTNKAKAIRFSTLEKICEILDCKPGDILDYENTITEGGVVAFVDTGGDITPLNASIMNESASKPKRVNEDEPVEEELPVFEKKLAGAIEGIAKYPGSKPEKEHLEQISWDGLCVHLMQIFEQQSVYRKNL